MGKKKKDTRGFVFSTDPDFRFEEENPAEDTTLPPSQQKLKVKLETRHRAGKVVTLVEGFVGSTSDRDELGKKLKNYCGTGGSVKDGEIIVQGDQREKVIQYLLKNGFTHTKRSGG